MINRKVQGICSIYTPIKGSYENFSLNLLLKSEDFEEFTGSKSGGGFSHIGTVINLIKKKDNEETTIKSINHEKTHNIFHAFIDNQIINDSSYFIKLIDGLIESKVNGESEYITNTYIKGLKKGIKEFLGSATPEIIADFGAINSGHITTAHGNYRELVRSIIELSHKINNSNWMKNGDKLYIQNVLNSFITELISEYKKIYKNLADFIYICDKEGKMNELFSLLIIYGVGKYHKIEKHLKVIIGNEKYKYYEIMRAIVKPQFFKLPKQDVGNKETELECAAFFIDRSKKEDKIGVLDNPVGFKNLDFLATKKVPDSLLDKNLINPIVNNFYNKDYKEVFKIEGIDNEEKLRKYTKLLSLVLIKLNIPKDLREYVINKVIDDFEDYSE